MNHIDKIKSESIRQTKPLKVLHLIDSGGFYGAEKMLLALADGQIKDGDYPVILSAGLLGEESKALELMAQKQGVSVKPWRMKSGFNLLEAFKILQWAKNEGIDLLHSHGYKFNILLGIFPKFVRKIPLVVTVHGYTAAKPYSSMWFYHLVDQWMVSKADQVVFVSKETERLDCFGHLVDWQKTVIYNGIIEGVGSRNYQSKNWSAFFTESTITNNNVLTVIGRLSEEKGLFVLIDAFSLLSQDNRQLKLVLFGEGPLRAELEERIKSLNLQSKIAMPGYVDDVEDWMNCSACLVMPSFSEGMPITLLEAIRSDVKIVASSVGGIPELLSRSNKSILVKAGDVEQLADAIKKSLEINLNSNDLNLALFDEFTKKHMVSRYSALYRYVLLNNKR